MSIDSRYRLYSQMAVLKRAVSQTRLNQRKEQNISQMRKKNTKGIIINQKGRRMAKKRKD